ncbi:MAG: insulinase family protein [Bacteroidaceae bacterium]|nr:insulinase family protein [Bacteroidaceae bacterium]
MRVVLAPSPTDVVYAGIAVATGTRHELDSESGMAHLVEHMTFKGTPRLTSLQILNRMERVGGDLNAYTGKEETIYYSIFLRQHLRRAIPLLLDIVFHSTFPQEELDKEVEVVIDEIESYNDSPAELIYDDFESLLFPGQPLGRKILGDADHLRQYRSADLRRFTERNYSPERALLFVKGNVSIEQVRKAIGTAEPAKDAIASMTSIDSIDSIASMASIDSIPPSLTGGGGSSILPKPVHQAHVMLGSRAYAYSDPRYFGLFLLNNLLGGPAMNSRLSLALRERAGLVYTVESSVTAYTDTGVWSTYFGCDAADVRRCLRLVERELRRLIDAPLPPRTLAAAKTQLKGQLGVSYDNFENAALGMAKRVLHDGRVTTPAEIFAAIDALTPALLQNIAADILDPARLTTLIYQPEA